MSSRRPNPTTRILLLRLLTVVIFVLMFSQLAVMQFVRGQNYQERASFNRSREVRTAAERGVIYDRDGRILARNTARFNIAVIPADLPDDPDYAISQQKREALYIELTDLILATLAEPAPPISSQPEPTPVLPPLTRGESHPPAPAVLEIEEIDELVSQREAGSAFLPVLIATDLPRRVALRIEEERYRLPGVVVLLQPQREYLAGPSLSHVLGYLGPIPEEANTTYREQGYSADAWVGLSGLELTFEPELRGQSGRKLIEVDVNGRERALIGEEVKPVAGHNLILSLDLELQQAMIEALARGINVRRSLSAVAVAVDPRSGFVLGMVSLPTYDNSTFADGITTEEYRSIVEAPGAPLLNHAISGIYPPASTFKLVPAAAGLEEGVIRANSLLDDPGVIYLPNRYFPDNPALAQPFVCWIHKLGGYHSSITVKEAIAESCDVFFYKLGGGWYATDFAGLGAPKLAEYALTFGFGELTGIELPGEHRGLIPDARWKRITKGERWVTGDTYNMSIGQGDVLATPLQVTMMTAAVANGGALYRPQLVAAITDAESRLVELRQPVLTRELPISAKNLAVVREGMWMVVNWPYGTALNVALSDVSVAGKTGTGEFYDPAIPRDARGNLPTHAWFTAFAPYEDPEIVITVFVYNGGEGSEVAAPIARDILRSYFDTVTRDQTAGSRSVIEQLEEAQP